MTLTLPKANTVAVMKVHADLGMYEGFLLPALREALPDVEFAIDGPADVFVTVPRPGRDLTGVIGPEIRWIHNLGAGIDGVPLDEVGERVLTCSRGASSVAIAEYVLGTMLAFEKRWTETPVTEPPAQWGAANLGGLEGRTLGLVGIGAIGTEVAKRALAFDMRVVAVRRTASPPDIDGVTLAKSLHDLLGEADHVVVAAPATDGTRRLFDASAFAATKPGAHFVNIARGALVDQDALIAALDSGHVAFASLDVVDPEPLPAGHPLFTHPKVRLTAHVSWSAPSTGARTVHLFVDNVRRYLAGERLHGIVDTAAGY
jgi:phosphoglycerate dehydrogenase-like enzyme